MLDQGILDFLLIKLEQARPYKAGIKACCPFHDEHTPSFFIFEHDNNWFYKCHGCNKSGLLNFLLECLKTDQRVSVTNTTPRTANQLAEVAHIVNTTGKYQVDYSYYLSRGLTKKIVDKFQLKWDMIEEAAVFPIYMHKRYMGWIKRHTVNNFRYEIMPGLELSNVLWGWDHLVCKKNVFIVEGIIDAANLWADGFQAVALCNKAWKSRLNLLTQLENPVIIPDNDPSGLAMGLALSNRLGNAEIQVLPYEYKDYSEWKMKTKTQSN